MIFQFEEFELDTDKYELRESGQVKEVEPQVFSLLEFLVSNHGQLVTKDEILDHVWQGRFISESALSSRMTALRAAIGDDGKSQRLVKTVHGRGFRFVGTPVLFDGGSASVAAQTPQKTSKETLGPPTKNPSIAVLPFDNMSGDADQEHLADGMCEDIITVLSKVPGLFVIARNSTFAFKGKNIDIRQVGKELAAGFVLEGSIRKQGNIVRVTGQLIDSRTGHHVWAERFDRQLQDIFQLQDELTREIVSALQVNLTEGERAKLWSGGTESFDAWEKQIQSPALISTLEKSKVLQGRKLSEEALSIDPKYSEAWSAIGMSYFVESLGGWGTAPEICLKHAVEALGSALEENEKNPTALAGLGLAQIVMRDFAGGIELVERGYSLAPNSSEIASLYALGSLYCGEYDKCGQVLREAINYFPVYPAWYQAVLGTYHLIRNELEKAVEAAAQGIKIDPDYLHSHTVAASGHAQLGNTAKANEAVQNILRLNPNYTVRVFEITQPFKEQAIQDRLSKSLTAAGLPDR